VSNGGGPTRGGAHRGGEAAGQTGVLRETLRAARNLLRRIAGDSLLLRLLDVYSRMPAQDREVIVTVLEREVSLRVLATATPHASTTGIRMARPNPNARLYVRVLDRNDDAPYVSREEMMHAMLRTVRALHLTLSTTEHSGEWEASVRDALARVSPAEIEGVKWVNRRLLALADEVAPLPDAAAPAVASVAVPG